MQAGPGMSSTRNVSGNSGTINGTMAAVGRGPADQVDLVSDSDSEDSEDVSGSDQVRYG